MATVYTVIGVYREPLGQRYASTVEADSPEEAEGRAIERCAADNGLDPGDDPGLMVAAVLEGEVRLVDMYTDGVSS